MNNEEYKKKLKDLFFALDECEKAWEMACETGDKYDYFEKSGFNILNDCAACEHNRQVYKKVNSRIWDCNGVCIIKWGKIKPDKENGFVDPINSFACERYHDSPYEKWINGFENANEVLECVRKSKKYYQILFRKFKL